jgi:uncharacterized RDD family membrane protein YckC
MGMGENGSAKRRRATIARGSDASADGYNPYAAPKDTPSRDVPTRAMPEEDLLASLGQRLLGAVVDSVLIFVALALGYLWVKSFHDGSAFRIRPKEYGLLLAPPVLVELVQATLITRSAQSIGKIVAKTRIARLDGSPPGFVRGVLVRQWLIYALGFLPVAGTPFGLLDLLFVFSRNRRTLHDLFAGTRVIRA